MPERMLVGPDSLVDALAHAQENQALIAPASVQRHHEQGPTDASRVLRDVVRVTDESVIFQVRFADIRLEQDICLALLLTGSSAMKRCWHIFWLSHLLAFKASSHRDLVSMKAASSIFSWLTVATSLCSCTKCP